MIAKCVQSVAKGEAQEACGIDQFCGELQAGRFRRWCSCHALIMGDTQDGIGQNEDSFLRIPAMPLMRLTSR